MADLRWRLNRCAQLEHNLFALGRVEFAQSFDDEAEPVRAALIQAQKCCQLYERSWSNCPFRKPT